MAERLIPGVGLVIDQTDGEQNLIPGGGLVGEESGATTVIGSVGQAVETATALAVAAITPITVAITQAVETGTALAVAALTALTVSVGAAAETDTAQAVTAITPITVAVSQSSETDTANAVAAITPITVAVSQSSETDTAQAVTASTSLTVAVGQSSETDTAQAVAALTPITVAVGQSSETDTAQAVTASSAVTASVGQSSETDTANAVTAITPITVAVGQSSETDTAQVVTPASLGAAGSYLFQDGVAYYFQDGVGYDFQAGSGGGVVAVGQAAETDTANAVSFPISVGQAAETDSAQPVAAVEAVTVGLASETDTALIVEPHILQIVPIGAAQETDTALALALITGTFTRYNLYFEEHLDPIKRRGKVVLNRPLTTGEHIEIQRYTPRYTTYEAIAQTPFEVEQLEYALDKICFIQQELEGHLCGCPAYPDIPVVPEQPDDPIVPCLEYSCDAFVSGALSLAENVYPMDDPDRYPVGPQDRFYKDPASTGSENMLILPDPAGSEWGNILHAGTFDVTELVNDYVPCSLNGIKYDVPDGAASQYTWTPTPRPNLGAGGPTINMALVVADLPSKWIGTMAIHKTQYTYYDRWNASTSFPTETFSAGFRDLGAQRELFITTEGTDFATLTINESEILNSQATFLGVYLKFNRIELNRLISGTRYYVDFFYDYHLQINDTVVTGTWQYETNVAIYTEDVGTFAWTGAGGGDYYHTIYRAGGFRCVGLATNPSSAGPGWLASAYENYQRNFTTYVDPDCDPITGGYPGGFI